MSSGPLAESDCFTLDRGRRIVIGHVAMFAPRERETRSAFEHRIEHLAEELSQDGEYGLFWFTDAPCRLGYIFIQHRIGEIVRPPVRRGTRGGRSRHNQQEA